MKYFSKVCVTALVSASALLAIAPAQAQTFAVGFKFYCAGTAGKGQDGEIWDKTFYATSEQNAREQIIKTLMKDWPGGSVHVRFCKKV